MDAGALLCLDENGHPLGWPIRRGTKARYSELLVALGLYEHVIREVATSQRPLLIDGLSGSPPAKAAHGKRQLCSVGYVPLTSRRTTLGVLILASRQARAFNTATVRLLNTIGHQLALGLENFYLHSDALLLQKEKADLINERLAHVNRAQEEERKRLARDLHDDVLQSIALVIADLEYYRRNQALPTETREALSQQSGTLRAVLDATRRVVADLRLSTLDHHGLIGTLEGSLLQRFRREANCEVFLEHSSWPLALSRALSLNIYRIIQEALANVRKHARARQVWVRLSGDDAYLHVSVSDDGIGFDPDRVLTERQPVNYLGLVGLRERAELLGGHLVIESEAGRGTTVKVVIPRDRRAEEAAYGLH
jgi:signal transduction histidine kinase